MKTVAIDVAVGATAQKLNSLTLPWTGQFLSFAGVYAPELNEALIGTLAYKLLPGEMKTVGQKFFEHAAFNAGEKLGANMFGATTVTTGAAPSGVVAY